MASARDGYWRLVVRRATKDARAALLIETVERIVVGAVVTITAIALLWLFGSEGSSWDEALAKVGPWIVMILAVYPIVWAWKFVRAIAQIDAELRQKIDALEGRLIPKLEFTWRPGDNKYSDIVESPEGMMGHIIIGRAAIKNVSYVESIYGV